MPKFNSGEELPYLEKDDILMSGSPNSFSAVKAQNLFSRSLTYTQLETLRAASNLIIGQKYLITNATAANFNLIVEAIAVNKIGCEAKDPIYPNDVVKYNFASNVITWRWDTVNDISAGEDWRNSTDITIGANCKNINIGQNVVCTIGSGCKNIMIGDIDLSLTPTPTPIIIANNCSYITIGEDCSGVEFDNANYKYVTVNQGIVNIGKISEFGTDFDLGRTTTISRIEGGGILAFWFDENGDIATFIKP